MDLGVKEGFTWTIGRSYPTILVPFTENRTYVVKKGEVKIEIQTSTETKKIHILSTLVLIINLGPWGLHLGFL